MADLQKDDGDSGNITVPEGVISAEVFALGRGGSGGSGFYDSDGDDSSGGGGGGGGCYYENSYTVTPGQSIPYDLSAGDVDFDSVTVATKGSNGSDATEGAGGSGGAPGGGTYTGGYGGDGEVYSTPMGGGGGGAAGDGSNGFGGGDGSSGFGGAGGSVGSNSGIGSAVPGVGASASIGSVGSNGSNYGGGGAGGGVDGTSSLSGGDGGDAILLINWGTPQTPYAPSDFTVDSITTNSATLNWTDNSSIETNFTIELDLYENDYSSVITTYNPAADVVSHNLTDTYLDPNTHYKARLRAEHDAFYSSWVEVDFWTLAEGGTDTTKGFFTLM